MSRLERNLTGCVNLEKVRRIIEKIEETPKVIAQPEETTVAFVEALIERA